MKLLDDLHRMLREGQDEIANVSIFRQHPDHGIQVLISRNHKSDDLWALPGGRLEPGESPEEAARREIREETQIKLKTLIKITSSRNAERDKVVHTFAAIVSDSKDAEAGSDVYELKWKAIGRLRPMKWGDQLLVQMALLRTFDPGEIMKSLKLQLAQHLDEQIQVKSTPTEGLLLVVEGCDGGGKSTLAASLADWIRSQGHEVLVTSWGSSERLKQSIKKAKDKRELTPLLFCLMAATDLIWRYEHTIVPALNRGAVVICDRYYFTSMVRDQLRGIDLDLIRMIFRGIREPDLLLHCRVPVSLANRRVLAAKGPAKYYAAGMDLGYSTDQAKNAAQYAQNMDRLYREILPTVANYVAVDTAKDPRAVFAAVLPTVQALIRSLRPATRTTQSR